MEFNNFNEEEKKQETQKSKQLVRMLSFRVVPAYFREIEKVASKKKMSVSKLIRTYIKDGMKRDKEITNQEDKDFRDRVRTLPQSTFPTGNMINNFSRRNQFPGLVPYQPYIFHANFVIGNSKKIGLLRTFIYNSQFGNRNSKRMRRLQTLVYLLIRRMGFSIKKLSK